MDSADAEAEGWSQAADEWDALWGDVALPVWRTLLDLAALTPGARVLDVGCGSGHLLAHLVASGYEAAGADPATRMLDLARRRAPIADVRQAGAEHLPWSDGSFDLTIAVNALQMADDTADGLAEMVRVTAPGGYVAITNWAEGSRNDLDVLERAVAAEDDVEPPDDGELRRPGGLERLLSDAGLHDVRSGLVEVPWAVPDDDTLVRGVLLGEDHDVLAAYAPVVVAAARSFRRDDGSYRLVNHFRHAIGCTTATTR